MFDVGFWELALLAVLALVILGPERLPVVARTLGGWVRRARHIVHNFGEELSGDSSIHELREEVASLKSEIESEAKDTADRVNHMGMSDDLNGHGSFDADTENDHSRSIYEFSIDDVDEIPDTTVGDDDFKYDSVEDGFEHDAMHMDSEHVSASSRAPAAAAEYADSRHSAGDEVEVSIDNDEQDDEALYARARQRYLTTGDEYSEDDEVRSEGEHSGTAHAEPSDRA